MYIGVRTTGIYCRPGCPARPRQQNTRRYRSPAQAEAQGLRPCLRCCPDLFQTLLPVRGNTPSLVRALRGIEAGVVVRWPHEAGSGTDESFMRELGALPSQVDLSARLHHARLLLAQTPLAPAEVARLAGFSSPQSFHARFRRCYRRPVAALRRSSPGGHDGNFHLRLPVILPFDWDTLAAFLGNHATPGLECCEHGTYRRVLAPLRPGTPAGMEARFDGRHMHLLLRGIEPRAIRPLLARSRQLFSLDHVPALLPVLQGIEPGGVRVPGAFCGFETAVCIILGQLVSVAAARRLVARLVDAFGTSVSSPWPGLARLFPTPARLADADIASLGIPRRRAAAIRTLARQVHDDVIALSPHAPLAATRKALAAIPGIGPWTVETIAMRCLGDTDAFPSTDLVIRREVQRLGLVPTQWAPWRASLAARLWERHARPEPQR